MQSSSCVSTLTPGNPTFSTKLSPLGPVRWYRVPSLRARRRHLPAAGARPAGERMAAACAACAGFADRSLHLESRERNLRNL
ncbi:hypothetical protein MTO96_019584 [Rhipicephalus appendiculatus]